MTGVEVDIRVIAQRSSLFLGKKCYREKVVYRGYFGDQKLKVPNLSKWSRAAFDSRLSTR